MIKMYASSDSEPMEMSRKRRNSRFPCFADPSAMFAAEENAALLACFASSNLSDAGNFFVAL